MLCCVRESQLNFSMHLLRMNIVTLLCFTCMWQTTHHLQGGLRFSNINLLEACRSEDGLIEVLEEQKTDLSACESVSCLSHPTVD